VALREEEDLIRKRLNVPYLPFQRQREVLFLKGGLMLRHPGDVVMFYRLPNQVREQQNIRLLY